MYFCQELMKLVGLNSIAFSDDDDQVAETGSHKLMELGLDYGTRESRAQSNSIL